VIDLTADRCFCSPVQKPLRVIPMGVIAPIPVMTTLRLFTYDLLLLLLHLVLRCSGESGKRA
jgi:hypothetical protein